MFKSLLPEAMNNTWGRETLTKQEDCEERLVNETLQRIMSLKSANTFFGINKDTYTCPFSYMGSVKTCGDPELVWLTLKL